MSLLRELLGSGGSGTDLLGAQAWERLQPYLRGLFLEYGQTDCDVRPHDPADSPETSYLTPTEGNVVELDVESLLGKPATRGHVANNGTGEVIVSWVSWSGETFRGSYRLAPGGVLDTSSWIVRRISVEAPTGEGDAKVQTLWQ